MVTTYMGVPGITFQVEAEQDVYDVVDALHTQAIDVFGENHPLTNELGIFLSILSQRHNLF